MKIVPALDGDRHGQRPTPIGHDDRVVLDLRQLVADPLSKLCLRNDPGRDLESVRSSVRLAYPEGRAALAAARRAGRLTAGAHSRSLEDFEATHAELWVVGVDSALARYAGELAEELGLRGYDAVHLASALALGGDTTLITWNTDLARAGARVGCGVAPAP